MSKFGPSNSATFLYYFGTSTFITIVLASLVLHLPPTSGLPNQLGLLMGLAGGLVGTFFNRSITLEQEISGHKKFLNRLSQPLETMGYFRMEDDSLPADMAVYARSGLRGLLSGRVYVHLDGKQAYVTSRAVHVRKLKQAL